MALESSLDSIFEKIAAESRQPEVQPSAVAMRERGLQIVASEQSAEEKSAALRDLLEQLEIGFKDKISALDRGESIELGNYSGMPVEFEDGALFASHDNGGQWDEVTVGELMTDCEWEGMAYSIQSGDIPKRIGRQFVEAQAHIERSYVKDLLIMVEGVASDRTNTGPKYIYEKTLQERRERILHPGHIAELMAKNIIAKLHYDYGVDIEIEIADKESDVQGVDFIIRRTHHERGVIVQEDSSVDTIMVQFTINTDDRVLGDKQRRLDNAEHRLKKAGFSDVALVKIGPSLSAEMLRSYTFWNEHKRPGGPDRLLSESTIESLIREILDKMFTQEELDQICQKVVAANSQS